MSERVAVVVYLTADDEHAAAVIVAAALQDRATIDGRRLSLDLRGHRIAAEVAKVEPLNWAFNNAKLTLTPGYEPYAYLDRGDGD